MKRALPWLVAVAAALIAIASWFRPVPGAREKETAHTEHPATEEPKKDLPPQARLRATEACLGRLELAQAALSRCRGATRVVNGPPEKMECLSDSEVARAVEQSIEDAIRDHVELERDRRIQARARERSAFDEWSKEALQLSTEESEWLESYVCAARELRTRTLASLEEKPATQALEQLKQQRAQILEDLEEALGAERYSTLRAIGGIGLVADTTDCG